MINYPCHKCKKEYEVYFDEMLAPYGAFMSPAELVELGIYSSNDAAYQGRRKGIAPPYVRIGRMIKYPTMAVSIYLKDRLIEEENKKDEHGEEDKGSFYNAE